MKISTIVEFFWGTKTTYTRVELYPDGRIVFPDYDIEHDIVLAELGEEPTQQFELYDAYSKYGIFGFDLIGKNSYFWASDYYKALQRPGEKRKWASFIRETLDNYLYEYIHLVEDEQLVDYQIEFIANIIREFTDSFEVKQTLCWAEEEHGKQGFNLTNTLLCKADIVINGNKCMDFATLVNGSYGSSLPQERKWTYQIATGLIFQGADKYWYNIDQIIREVEGYQGYIKDVPEPFELDPLPSPFKSVKNPKYVVVIWRRNELCFFNGYKSLNLTKKAIDYIYKWFSIERGKIVVFEKTDPRSGNFDFAIERPGRMWVTSPGWEYFASSSFAMNYVVMPEPTREFKSSHWRIFGGSHGIVLDKRKY